MTSRHPVEGWAERSARLESSGIARRAARAARRRLHGRRTGAAPRATCGQGVPMLKVGGPTGLDALDRLDAATLGARYAEGRVPASMRAVDGPLPGRMLAVIGLAAARAPLRGFASSAAFPWEGKTFRAADDLTGAGINRIRLPGLLGRQDLFPFHTRFGPSAVDGAPALILDYDLAVNPPWIRAIHDEIREVDPGLFLGPAMWKAASGPVTVLWFGLDARCAAP